MTRSTSLEEAPLARRATRACRLSKLRGNVRRAYYGGISGANDRIDRVLALVGGRGLALLETLVQPGGVAVDAGASGGLYTSRLSKLVGVKGAVHAFEPNPASRLQLNTIASALGNVVVHDVALSDRPGRAVLHVPVRNGGAVDALGRLEPFDGRQVELEVETVRLDDVVPSATFIKCDVEGHELAVLRGASETLAKRRPTLLVEIEWRHAGDAFEETFRYLHALGYAGSAIRADGPVPLDEFDLERDQIAHLGDELPDGRMPKAYVNDFVFRPS